MYTYFFIALTDFMLNNKWLADFPILFSPNNFKINDKIILTYFQKLETKNLSTAQALSQIGQNLLFDVHEYNKISIGIYSFWFKLECIELTNFFCCALMNKCKMFGINRFWLIANIKRCPHVLVTGWEVTNYQLRIRRQRFSLSKVEKLGCSRFEVWTTIEKTP